MRPRFARFTTLLALVAGLDLTPTHASAQDPEVVIEWNRILQVAVATPGALPSTTFFTRPYALVSVAVFDAANSINHRYSPYAVRARAESGASADAAVAQAAHDVIVAMMPSLQATADAALAASLSRVSGSGVADGIRVGATVAREILELRAEDGWNRPPPPYILPDMAGYWQPTPTANAPAALTHYPDVVPFAIGSARQFLAGPPPSMTTAHYADDFDETKSIGSVNSTTRTTEQTTVARLWAGVGTSTTVPMIWNSLVRDLVRQRGMSGIEAARAFALVNMAVHDALLVSFTGKFVYGLWRPVTAIRSADRDGNPATEPDPAWLPLRATPPYPSYPGNMSCIGASAARVLALVFGRDNVPFAVTWTGTGTSPNVTRSYNGFRELADEEARSRVWGGIHFQFDTLASQGVCTPLGEYTAVNYLRPVGGQ
jgi:hypothetical protein